MSTEENLISRSGNSCELCKATDNLAVFVVPPKEDESDDNCAYLCQTCQTQIQQPETIEANHWHCLNETMWSEVAAVQVLAWRILNQIKAEGWPQDLLDMLYLEDETQAWASAGQADDDEESVIHKDSNGAQLQQGDTVTLIKDLNVKGANFTAKRGTAVRNINLVSDNAEHIEGKVNGQQIVILTQFVKKS